MIELFELTKGIKIRLWVNELPEGIIRGHLHLSGYIHSIGTDIWRERRVAVELSLPKHNSSYGLLGLEFFPNCEQEGLEIQVNYCDTNNNLFHGTLARVKNTVFSNLPKEYAEAVIKKTIGIIRENPCIPSGSLVFSLGAHCEIGSSRFLFGIITEILLRMLFLNKDNYAIGEIERILKDLSVIR
jgi:hypothetical protein